MSSSVTLQSTLRCINPGENRGGGEPGRRRFFHYGIIYRAGKVEATYTLLAGEVDK